MRWDASLAASLAASLSCLSFGRGYYQSAECADWHFADAGGFKVVRCGVEDGEGGGILRDDFFAGCSVVRRFGRCLAPS